MIDELVISVYVTEILNKERVFLTNTTGSTSDILNSIYIKIQFVDNGFIPPNTNPPAHTNITPMCLVLSDN